MTNKKEIYSLYSDGNYFPRAKKSGFGGYIQDENGQILIEYSEQIKKLEFAYCYEILGILRGLQLAKSMEIKNIRSYCDAKDTIIKINDFIKSNSADGIVEGPSKELYKKVFELIKDFDSVHFEYIPRALNKHSDSLSRRYAVMMEKNFFAQYEKDLDRSHKNLTRGINAKNKMYFFNTVMVENHYKNNPFMVAQHRNQKMRKISREEVSKNNYNYIFLEMEYNDNDLIQKAYLYTEAKGEKKLINKQVIKKENINNENLCIFLENSLDKYLKNNKNKKIWLYSNLREFNNILEQKEKISSKEFEIFQKLHNNFSKFERIFYHWLPFEHELDVKPEQSNNKKRKIEKEIESADVLIEQIENGLIDKHKKKFFGLLVRYQLKNYKELLGKELTELDKQSVITKTAEDLMQRGLEIPAEIAKSVFKI